MEEVNTITPLINDIAHDYAYSHLAPPRRSNSPGGTKWERSQSTSPTPMNREGMNASPTGRKVGAMAARLSSLGFSQAPPPPLRRCATYAEITKGG